ncbi:MAG: prenyltransferase [Gracilibacteraceae bacterium]|nr:prenyltransferase [Gracilibacteraceae bacterium]
MASAAEQIDESLRTARVYALEGLEKILRGRLDETYGVSASPGATALAAMALLFLGSPYKESHQAGLQWLKQNRRNQGWGKVPGGEPDEEITRLVKKVFWAGRCGRLAKYFLPGQLKELSGIILSLGQDVVPGMVGPLPEEIALPQILADHVLNKLPPYGRPVVVAAALLAAHDAHQDGIDEAAAYLRGCQMDDGSWSEDVVVTSLAIIALLQIKAPGENLDRAGRWLVSKQYPSGAWPAFDHLFTWSVGLAIRCFTEFPLSPAERAWITRAASWLESGQNADGSYGSTPPFTQPDLDDTAVALMGLQRVNSKAAHPAVKLLLGLQNEDGSWGTFPNFHGFPPEVSCGFPVYIASTDVTLHVVDALRGMSGAEINPAVSQGVHWLLAQQLPSGEFPGTWYEGPIYSTAQVLEFLAQGGGIRRRGGGTLHPAKSILTAQDAALQYLISSQNADGSWGNSVVETALALSALCATGQTLPPEIMTRGVASIMARQLDNGSFQPAYRGIYAKGWNYEEPLTTALTAITALERYQNDYH